MLTNNGFHLMKYLHIVIIHHCIFCMIIEETIFAIVVLCECVFTIGNRNQWPKLDELVLRAGEMTDVHERLSGLLCCCDGMNPNIESYLFARPGIIEIFYQLDSIYLSVLVSRARVGV